VNHLDDAWNFAVLIKVAAAVGLGGLIGWQRELYNKPAGLRTHILIVLGATMVMEVSRYVAHVDGGDPGRIAANIIVGIGFIGAGTIMKEGPTVYGLTSAATIWVNGALGCAIGAGYWSASIVLAGTTIVVLTLLKEVEGIARKGVVRRYVATSGEVDRLLALVRSGESSRLIKADSLDLCYQGPRLRAAFTVAGAEPRHLALVAELRPLCESLEILSI